MTAISARTSRTGLVDWFWLMLPYLLLVITTTLTLLNQPPGSQVPSMLVLIAVFVVWHWWWAIRHRQWLEQRLLPMAVYFLGFLVCTTLLSLISFSFFPLYLIGFAIAFVVLPGGWAYGGVLVTAGVAFLAPRLLNPSFDNIAAIVGGGALASAAGWSIRALERSQQQLRAALAANIELQERLVADAREAGVTAERARLAAEFHDTVATGLTAIISQLDAMDAELAPDDPARARLQTTAEVARDSLREARRSVAALRPAVLAGRTLASALAQVTSAFQRGHEIPVVLQISGTETRVSDEVEQAVLRVAQESLANVARHANATIAHVTVSYFDDEIILDVSDDGRGIPNQQASNGHGIELMRQRVEQVGGQLSIVRGEPAGTTVTAQIPLPTDGAPT